MSFCDPDLMAAIDAPVYPSIRSCDAWIVYRVECSVIAMFDDLRIFIKSHPAFLVVPKG